MIRLVRVADRRRRHVDGELATIAARQESCRQPLFTARATRKSSAAGLTTAVAVGFPGEADRVLEGLPLYLCRGQSRQ
jgi:hypothetical protein